MKRREGVSINYPVVFHCTTWGPVSRQRLYKWWFHHSITGNHLFQNVKCIVCLKFPIVFANNPPSNIQCMCNNDAFNRMISIFSTFRHKVINLPIFCIQGSYLHVVEFLPACLHCWDFSCLLTHFTLSDQAVVVEIWTLSTNFWYSYWL